MKKPNWEKKIENVLFSAIGAITMITLMEGKCTDGTIKLRDDTIKEIKEIVRKEILKSNPQSQGNNK